MNAKAIADLPERPKPEYIQAILAAWDHYGPAGQPRLFGTPEAERIYRYLRAAILTEKSHDP